MCLLRGYSPDDHEDDLHARRQWNGWRRRFCARAGHGAQRTHRGVRGCPRGDVRPSVAKSYSPGCPGGVSPGRMASIAGSARSIFQTPFSRTSGTLATRPPRPCTVTTAREPSTRVTTLSGSTAIRGRHRSGASISHDCSSQPDTCDARWARAVRDSLALADRKPYARTRSAGSDCAASMAETKAVTVASGDRSSPRPHPKIIPHAAIHTDIHPSRAALALATLEPGVDHRAKHHA